VRDENFPSSRLFHPGGMQTKEGAGALFPMAILNEPASRDLFVKPDQPVLCFGFGDCTAARRPAL
jgi:hypothetical protein